MKLNLKHVSFFFLFILLTSTILKKPRPKEFALAVLPVPDRAEISLESMKKVEDAWTGATEWI